MAPPESLAIDNMNRATQASRFCSPSRFRSGFRRTRSSRCRVMGRNNKGTTTSSPTPARTSTRRSPNWWCVQVTECREIHRPSKRSGASCLNTQRCKVARVECARAPATPQSRMSKPSKQARRALSEHSRSDERRCRHAFVGFPFLAG